MTRKIFEIAAEISADWKKVYFGAVPYLDAMHSIGSITERYGEDRASMVVAYFLGNARGWKGETAKRVKAELNKMLKKGGSG